MKTDTLKIIENFYNNDAFSSLDLITYDKKDTFKITHMPLEKFKDKVPNELISKLIEPCFLKNKHYNEIMQLLLKNTDNESFYHLMYTAYYKTLLENMDYISDKYHLSDLNIIAKSDKELSRHLMTTAIAANSLKSNYHETDMNVLKNETSGRAELLNLITTNMYSLNSPHHKRDMELLTNQKDETIFYSLILVAEDKDSLDSPYHMHDMDLINNMDDPKMTIPLSLLAISRYSLHNNHLNNINDVLNCDTYKEAKDYVDKLLYKKR